MRPSSILPNQPFGKLTTVAIHHRNSRGDAWWSTICECGNTHIARAASLKNGGCRSCGCMAAETYSRQVGARRAASREIITTLPELVDGRYIPMTRGNVLIVPPESYDFMMHLDWVGIKPRHSWYAVAPIMIDGKRTIVYAHRLLMGFPEGKKIDHEDRFGLDCRWSNMRTANSSENGANRGPNKGRLLAKGVYWDATRNKYLVSMGWREDGKMVQKFLGRFDSYEAACSVALKARIDRWGDFASIL